MDVDSIRKGIDYTSKTSCESSEIAFEGSILKRLVLDTSVLLHDPTAMMAFDDHEVIIPREVVLELDKIRKSDRSVAKEAREVISILKEIFLPEQNADGFFYTNKFNPQPYLSLYTKAGGKITLFLNDPASYLFYGDQLSFFEEDESEDMDYLGFRADTSGYDIFHYPGIEIDSKVNNYAKHFTDYMILQSCIYNHADLVTRDYTLMLFAIQFGVNAEYYQKEYVPHISEKLHTTLYFDNEDIDTLYKDRYLTLDTTKYEVELSNNELLEIKSVSNTALGRYVDGKIKLVDNHIAQGIKGKNREQRFAIDALMDSNIDMVTITGVAGTGKTLLAISAAIEQTLEKGDYEKVLVCRPTFSYENEDIGFLPGDEDDKTRPWLQPIYDNISFIYNQKPSEIIDEFKARNVFEVQVLQYIRGRSIINQFFIVDEVQNLDKRQIKKVISRAGFNTKIVLTGDISQIDNSHLSKDDNGLSYVIEKFSNQNNFVHINLTKTERSRLAEQATKLL